MRSFLTVIFAVLCTLTLPASASQQGAISVVGTKISGLLENRPQGPYNKIFDLLVKDYTSTVSFAIAPMKRAERLFTGGKALCVFVGAAAKGYYVPFGWPDSELIVSEGIFPIKVRVYGPKGSEPIESTRSLDGVVIAIDVEMGNVEYVAKLMGHKSGNVLAAPTLRSGFQMLDAGRVTGLVAIDSDVKYLQKNEAQFRGYAVSETFNVYETEDVMVCKKTSVTIPFMQHVDSQILSLKQSGTIEKILSESFLGDTAGNAR